MKLISVLLFLACTFTSFFANAAYEVSRRDLKLATQQMIEKRTVTTPVLADVNRLKLNQASSSSVTTTVTTFLAQPDVCRNITVTPGGTTASVPAGDVVVTGTNIFGATITENLAFLADASTVTAGLKAFCTVSSVLIPVQDGAGATYNIGVGDVLGLHRCMANAGNVIFATFNGAYEATRPTCVADSNEVEKNTCDINGTLDGAKTVEIFFIQNYGCTP